MALKTYSGSCHCGAVRFQTEIDLTKGTNRCNCSLCTKTRSWFVLVEPEHFRLTAGSDAQTEYQWVPPRRSASNLHFRFCRTCGIRTVAAAPLHYFDGRHDRYDRSPEDTRLM